MSRACVSSSEIQLPLRCSHRATSSNMIGGLGVHLQRVLSSNKRDRRTKGRSLSKRPQTVLNLRGIVSQNTDDFCRNTTLHGLKYIGNPQLNLTERCFFGVSFIAVLLFTGFFILKVYEKWSTTPVIFSINPQPTFITNEPFPAVTICNLNQALRSKAEAITKNSVEYDMLQMLCRRTVNATLANGITDWGDLEQFILNVSQPCEDMLIGCRFGAERVDCKNIFRPIITDEGLCCVFNMVHPKYMYISHVPLSFRYITPTDYEPVNWYAEQGYPPNLPLKFYPRKASGTGESLGLSLTLDVEYDKYYCSSSNSFGFKLALHSPNESPNVRETGVLISPGRETKVRIKPEKTESDNQLRSLKKKYRRCLFHDEGELRYFAHYTQRNCEMECVAQMVHKYCGCLSYYMPKVYENATTCSTGQVQCAERVRLHIDRTIESCLDNCLPSCFEVTFISDAFATQLAQGDFGTTNDQVKNFTKIDAQKSLAVVNMYIKEYSFRSHIQTEFIGISDFLSSVGGLMGLFLGFSFISIVELIYYALIRPAHMVSCRKNSCSRMHSSSLSKQNPRSGYRRQLRKVLNELRNCNAVHNRATTSSPTAINEDVLKSISKALESGSPNTIQSYYWQSDRNVAFSYAS